MLWVESFAIFIEHLTWKAICQSDLGMLGKLDISLAYCYFTGNQNWIMNWIYFVYFHDIVLKFETKVLDKLGRNFQLPWGVPRNGYSWFRFCRQVKLYYNYGQGLI